MLIPALLAACITSATIDEPPVGHEGISVSCEGQGDTYTPIIEAPADAPIRVMLCDNITCHPAEWLYDDRHGMWRGRCEDDGRGVDDQPVKITR
jgi:hypothetical protein